MKKQQICVIGAGVMGLSSALHIQDICPEADVTIIADKFSPNTTSDVSAGFWMPHLVGSTPPEKIRSWSQSTWDHLTALAHSKLASELGACLVSGYLLSPVKLDPPLYWDQVLGFREVNQDEMAKFPGAKHGFFYTTVMIEVRSYLPWLMKRFKERGGKVQQRRISSLNELSGQYELVVNCPGVEARQLVGDHNVESVRGQVIRVKAPWLKTFLMVTNTNPDYLDAYIFPGANEIVLGGIEQVGDWNLQNRDVDRDYVWKTCTTLLPCLQSGVMMENCTGLRPVRTSVRLEVENLPLGGRSMKVVHCYGHGGSGITLHWGCAKDVADLVKRELNGGTQKLSKL